ncbi:tyrosine-type recombinase/integrase [Sphingomonas sp. Ag1]|uniref:tyrosine-type recombinase/integrase n=1 Tax=Sphingomonas sp. Ag1 TaxID=1642949 RepID=UPI000621F742|nr:integrase arm-type DNA-binding domain-containing protein [Sphingomonas sp. Ag1]KKI18246.1 integrase [Sphingomonas sp. Ag1]
MLTNAAVKAARPRAAAYKLPDGAGLHLFIAPTGLKSFRLRFRYGGREQLLTIGSYPEVDLVAARARAEAARAQLARGEDPRARSSRVDTFEAAARAWHAVQAEGWTAVHAADVLVSLERDVFPAIGAEQLDAIAPADVLELLRAVEARGARETARRLRQRISAVFELAIGEGWCSSDPAEKVARGLKKPAAVRHHAALVSIDDARALMAAVDQLEAAPAAKLASRFLALTAMRWAAVRGARWSEIEDLDGDAPTWRVPAARMKLAAAKKGNAAHDHVVPLSPAAVAVLRAAQSKHDQMSNAAEIREFLPSDLIFAGNGSNKPLGEAAIGALYARTAFAGRHVPHGWRATFSTIMNEAMPLERGAIDQALGHALKSEDGSIAKVEGAYNRSQQLDRRRRIFDAWGVALVG